MMTIPDQPNNHGKPVGPTSGIDDTSPADMKISIAAQTLRILWHDETTSEFTFPQLRHVCPCATCRTEREKKQDNPLQILKSDPTNWRVTNAQLVGHYAIQFFWSDGHNAGIYDFRLLRSLANEMSRPTSDPES